MRIRYATGMSQEYFSEKVDISPRYLQSIEGGRRWPSIIVLIRIQKSLKCDWNDLFSRLERD